MATVKEIMDLAATEPLNVNVLRSFIEETANYNAELPEEAFEVDDENWGSDKYYIIRQDGEWILMEPDGGEVNNINPDLGGGDQNTIIPPAAG